MSSVALAAFLFLGPPIGEFVNRFGCRLATVIGCLTCSVALALGSVAPNIIVLYLAFSVLFGVGNTFVYISAPVIITQYFSRRRSFALGFVTAGQGLGTMICGPVLQALVGLFDWRNTFLIFAAVLGFSSLTGCLINRGNQEPTSTSTQGKKNHGKFSCDLSIWKRPIFLVLLVVGGLSNFSRMVPYVHLVSVSYHFHPRPFKPIQWPTQPAGTQYPGFCSMKRPEVFLLLPTPTHHSITRSEIVRSNHKATSPAQCNFC